MKVSLSFEKGSSKDLSIMVDALRASTTITMALNNFDRIIPCSTFEDALKVKEEVGGVLAGERKGKMIEGCDIGNSPVALKDSQIDEKTLILTTSNGTRILKNMSSKVLVGSLVNAKAVAQKSIELAETHIDIVMAGVRGKFAIEDFLAGGEIIYWICEYLDEYELSEYAKSAVLASRDYDLLKEAFMSSRSGKRLTGLGYIEDVELCCEKNITDNVAVYNNNELNLYI